MLKMTKTSTLSPIFRVATATAKQLATKKYFIKKHRKNRKDVLKKLRNWCISCLPPPPMMITWQVKRGDKVSKIVWKAVLENFNGTYKILITFAVFSCIFPTRGLDLSPDANNLQIEEVIETAENLL